MEEVEVSNDRSVDISSASSNIPVGKEHNRL